MTQFTSRYCDILLGKCNINVAMSHRKKAVVGAIAELPSYEWTQELGAQLRRLRTERGLRQQDLAEHIGAARTVYSNWETGTRRPSEANLGALAAVLGISIEELVKAPRPAEPSLADTEAHEVPASPEVIRPDEVSRFQTFVQQRRLLERLAGEQEITAARWKRNRAFAGPDRAEFWRLSGSGSVSAVAADAIGGHIAQSLRAQLGLGNSPLPPMTATVELLGCLAFQAPFSPSEAGRLRGVLVESEALGAVVLVNSMLDHQHRMHALAEMIGQALLQPPTGVQILSASTAGRDRRRPQGLRRAATAFADELLMPAAVLDDYSLERALTASRAADLPYGGSVEDALADQALLYRCPPGVLVRHLGRRHRVKPETEVQLIRRVRSRLWNITRQTPIALGWRASLGDVPRRFVTLIAEAVLDGKASLGGIAQSAGLDADDLESVLTGVRDAAVASATDDGWLDDWHVLAA